MARSNKKSCRKIKPTQEICVAINKLMLYNVDRMCITLCSYQSLVCTWPHIGYGDKRKEKYSKYDMKKSCMKVKYQMLRPALRKTDCKHTLYAPVHQQNK